MAVQGGCAYLAFCKLGDATWTDLPAPHHGYDSVAYCSKDQLFYAVSDEGAIEAWDVRDPSSIKRISVDRYMDGPMPPKYKGLEARLRMKSNKKHYLMESSGDLLLVVRHYYREWNMISHKNKDNYQTVRFDVYKFNLASPTSWTRVENLQDRALFVGLTTPFSLSPGDFPGSMGNSIYFADDEQTFEVCPDLEQASSHDVGIFNLEGNILKFYHPFGSTDSRDDTLVWIAPNVCG